MQKKFYKKAFSIIELSIVLLIFGILISGIFAGRNLIDISRLSSARSTTFSSQITSIDKMILWIESSTKDSFDNSEIIDNSQITSWYNITPSTYLVKNNLTTIASDNVIYKENSINKLPAVRFNGLGNMSISEFSGAPSLANPTIIMVFRPTILVDTTVLTLFDSGSSSNPSFSIGIRNNGVMLNSGTAAYTSISSNAANFYKDENYILMASFNGSSSKVFVNNIVEVGGSGATINPGESPLNGITLGTDKNGSSGINAEIAEVIIFNKILNENERETIMKYLSIKYKINVSGLE